MNWLEKINGRLTGRTRKVGAAVAGTVLILLGVLMGFLPFSPGIVLVLLGLGVLSSAFPWAGRMRRSLEAKSTEYRRRFNRKRDRRNRDRVT